MTSRGFGIPLAIGALALVAWLLTELSMKVYLFSATQGVVTRNGAPVANAEVERSYKWNRIMKFLGRGAETVKEATTTFIRWCLGLFLNVISGMAQRAMYQSRFFPRL